MGENTFKFGTVVYTCSIPCVNMKYSLARSYACQDGSMLRNLSPGSAGTISHKFFIYKTLEAEITSIAS